MNHPQYFEIQADNVERAVKFYNKIFNWKFEKQPNLPISYYRIETNGISGGLLQRPIKSPNKETGANASVISMQVENFDNTAAVIISSGGKIRSYW